MHGEHLRILVSGYIIRRPQGGLAWHYLHYVLGLLKLGHDVYYVEDSGDQPACFDPGKLPTRNDLATDQQRSPHNYVQKDPSYGLNFASKIFRRLGIPDKWAYFDAHGSGWIGPATERMDEILRSSDLLLNVSNSLVLRPWFLQIPARALVDTDPVFGQLRHKHLPVWRERAIQHTSFLTFGENFGNQECSIPADGLPWVTTRQPLVLAHWPLCPPSSAGKFTTIMSWDSYPPGEDHGARYGLKSDSFVPFMDLPKVTGLPGLEMAMECPPSIWNMLENKGWKLRDATKNITDPWKYQRYIQSSMGEFTVAKHGYVSTRSGWFSERSAAYLASGRPVVTQDTGFSDWMDARCGVVSFKSPDEAAARLKEVVRDYQSHCAAARKIAETYFDYRQVVPDLLEKALTRPVIAADLSGTELLSSLRYIEDTIDQVLPADANLILIDDQQLGVEGRIAGRRCLPFLEKEGVYWGNPPHDEMAIGELERLRNQGIGFVVFAEPAFWWTESYVEFYDYVGSKYQTIWKCDKLIIYDLRQPELSFE